MLNCLKLRQFSGRVIDIEKRFYDKSCAFETFIGKSKLFEKDDVIKDLTEKVHSLLENETEADVHELSEAEKTFCNRSDVVTHCLHCNHNQVKTWKTT